MKQSTNALGGGAGLDWTHAEVVLVLSLIRDGRNPAGESMKEVARLLGRTIGSVELKVGNLRHVINGAGGFDHHGYLDRKAVDTYRGRQVELDNDAARIRVRLLDAAVD